MPDSSAKIGQLHPDTFPKNGLLNKTIEFIAGALLPWRDDPDRPPEDSEELLNAQLQNFLQDQAILKFPMIIFQHEQRKSEKRRVDIGVHPTGTGKYQPFLVIEGKRLPAPPPKSREREYVTGEKDEISGGIQRFKTGAHGANHNIAIIIGYIQKESPHYWFSTINNWISELAQTQPNAWNESEKLSDFQSPDSAPCAKSFSVHPRANGCKSENIGLHHFWILMN